MPQKFYLCLKLDLISLDITGDEFFISMVIMIYKDDFFN